MATGGPPFPSLVPGTLIICLFRGLMVVDVIHMEGPRKYLLFRQHRTAIQVPALAFPNADKASPLVAALALGEGVEI